MTSVLFIIALVIAIFVVDIGGRWWRENEWKRRWKKNRHDD